MYEVGAKSVIEKILPVVDNFERGMATLNEEEAHSPFAEGLDKIYLYIFTLSEHGAKLGSEETRSVYELRQCG